MMWLKSCLKCHGDLYESRDHYGRYVTCLQCGHHLNDFEEITLGIVLSPNPLADTAIETAPELVASIS